MIRWALLIVGLCSFAGTTVCMEFSGRYCMSGAIVSTTLLTTAWATQFNSPINPLYKIAITGMAVTSSIQMCYDAYSFHKKADNSNKRLVYAINFMSGFIAMPLLLWLAR